MGGVGTTHWPSTTLTRVGIVVVGLLRSAPSRQPSTKRHRVSRSLKDPLTGPWRVGPTHVPSTRPGRRGPLPTLCPPVPSLPVFTGLPRLLPPGLPSTPFPQSVSDTVLSISCLPPSLRWKSGFSETTPSRTGKGIRLKIDERPKKKKISLQPRT